MSNWFDVVKIIGIPRGAIFVSNVVVNRAEFENTLDKLRNLKKVPSSLQGVLNRTKKTHKEYYNDGVNAATTEVDLTEEESKEMFDEMLQIMAEKTEEYTEREYLSEKQLNSLLSEAMKAKKDNDKEKISQIILEITKETPKNREWWSKRIPQRDKLQFLQEFLEGNEERSHLVFEDSSSNEEILQNFAELVEGTVENGKIFFNVNKIKTYNDFIRFLRPSKEEQKKFLEYKENNDGKKSDEEKVYDNRFKIYNETIRPLKPEFMEGEQAKKIDPRDLAAKELTIRDAKYEMAGTFNERSFERYIEIVAGLKGSLRMWLPNEFENGSAIPQGLIFVPRQSKNKKSLILNPYASITVLSDFSGENWFNTFFDSLRTNEVLTDDEVEQLLIDDISNALIEDKEQSRLGFRSASFSRIQKVRNLIINPPKQQKKRLNEVIRQIISESQGEGNLGEEITQKKLDIRREQLSLLQRYFTIKEGKKIKSLLDEQYDDDDIKVKYFDSSGTLIEEIEGDAGAYKERVLNAVYVEFEMFDDEDTVVNQENFNDWVNTNLTEVKKPVGKNPTRGLEIALKEVEQALENLPNVEMADEFRVKRKKKLEEDISRIKQSIEDRKSKPVSQEVTNKVQELRDSLLRPTDFVSFIQALGSKESLNDIIDKKIDSAKVLDQITPKNSLLFFDKMAQRVSGDEIGEAFNKINDNPNSDEAKAILIELDKKMPSLLQTWKQEIVKAFEIRLKFFLDNYKQKFQDKTNKKQVSPAINGFLRAGMIQEVRT
jgi:hypothetical protein